ACRSPRHDTTGGGALWRHRRSPHRGRHQGRARAARSRRGADLHRDGAACKVCGDDPRGAGSRARASRRVRATGASAAALRRAAPVIVLASDPAAGVLNFVLALPGNQGAVLGYSLQWLGFWLLVAWIAFIYWRAIATALMPRQPRFWLRSLAGAALLLAGVPLAIWAYQPWFYAAPPATLQGTRYPSPASEAVLIKQPQLLYEAVTELEDERPRVTDLYFV